MPIKNSKTILKLLFAILLFYGCDDSVQKAGFSADAYFINGKIDGMDSQWIYVVNYNFDTPGVISKIDSVNVKKGKFSFKGKVNEPDVWRLAYKDKKNRLTDLGGFVLEPGILNITANRDSSMLNAWGTDRQAEYQNIIRKINLISDTVTSIVISNTKAQTDIYTATLRYTEEIKKVIANHVIQNRSSIISAYIIKLYSNIYLDKKTVKYLYDFTTPEVKKSKFGRQIFAVFEVEKKTAVGMQAPYFEIPNKDGELISLNTYKGHYVFIDFWASWCTPCRVENKDVVNAYAKFKSRGIVFISISLDNDKTSWLKAINQDHLRWVQLCDLKGSNSFAKKDYGISSIPMNFLLDAKGKIIAKNLRGKELDKLLNNLYSSFQIN